MQGEGCVVGVAVVIKARALGVGVLAECVWRWGGTQDVSGVTRLKSWPPSRCTLSEGTCETLFTVLVALLSAFHVCVSVCRPLRRGRGWWRASPGDVRGPVAAGLGVF